MEFEMRSCNINNVIDRKLKENITQICEQKISQKWENVWLSFYVFFENKNNNPKNLFSIGRWWILENKFDHFEKATKIKKIVQNL